MGNFRARAQVLVVRARFVEHRGRPGGEGCKLLKKATAARDLWFPAQTRILDLKASMATRAYGSGRAVASNQLMARFGSAAGPPASSRQLNPPDPTVRRGIHKRRFLSETIKRSTAEDWTRRDDSERHVPLRSRRLLRTVKRDPNNHQADANQFRDRRHLFQDKEADRGRGGGKD